MKLIKTEEAAGHVLCHDMTQIIPGVKKDAAFRKGHIVKEEDIPVLLSMGKDNLYVWEKREGILHEDEAAVILRDICINDYMTASEPKEGKIEIKAAEGGLLKINTEILNKINSFGEMMIASRHGNFPVKKGDKIAGIRIIPLVIEEEKMKQVKEIAGDRPVFEIIPYKIKKAAIITTGNEVYYGRIKDAFGPVIKNKLKEYNITDVNQTILGDDPKAITREINRAIDNGAELVLCTGGMSVDPDDTTPLAVKNTGASVVSYGAPVLPGAMFLLAYKEKAAVMGLPGCVMYSRRTIFDLILPRVLAGEKLTLEDLSGYGEGGLCLECEICTFPNCGFGK